MSAATHDATADHAALMDRVYSLQRHVYDVTRATFLFGRDRTIRDLAPPPGGTVVEIGCGTARNLVRAARLHPDARLHGMDISPAMLATATRSVARHGLSHRIALARGDAGAMDLEAAFGLGEVDRFLFSYTLSMMPPWREALRAAAERLAPGGSLHVVDFGQDERLPSLVRRLHRIGMGTHHVSPRADLREELQAIAGDLDLSLGFEALLRGYVWRAVLRRDA